MGETSLTIEQQTTICKLAIDYLTTLTIRKILGQRLHRDDLKYARVCVGVVRSVFGVTLYEAIELCWENAQVRMARKHHYDIINNGEPDISEANITEQMFTEACMIFIVEVNNATRVD